MSAPKAPTPAASVGVAIPAIIEPKTTKIKVAGGKSVLKIFASPSISSMGRNFLPRLIMMAYAKYPTTIKIPGTIAPTNRSPTETVSCEKTPILFCAL